MLSQRILVRQEKEEKRREQMRELARQEKEEKWRAEERAQREEFEKAMLVLLQRLLGDGTGNFESGALTIPPVSSFDGNNQVLKKWSKNWKGLLREILKGTKKIKW